MSSTEFSQSRISTYLKCQQWYRYKYERSVTADEDTKNLEFGRALHETIRETCDRVREAETCTDEEIQDLADKAFQRQWTSEVNRDSYRTDAHYEDDRRLAQKAIEEFFSQGPGVDHARRSMVAELPVAFERNGISYSGYIDNVLKTDDGLELIDYKKSSIKEPVSSRKNYIQLQSDGEYRPRRVKHAIQAMMYIEGVKETKYYEPGDTIAFTYQPLAEVTVDRKGRTMTFDFEFESKDGIEHQVQENSQTLWEIIEGAVEGIRDGAFEPEPLEEIKDEQCDHCPFQSMCTTYLTTEEFKL